MAGFTSDEWPVDPVVVISGNQGKVPDGTVPTSKQRILVGINGSDRGHTFSLRADGNLGVGLDDHWSGSYGAAEIQTERLTEQITMPNGSYLAGRNAADSSTDRLIGYDPNGTVQIAPGGQPVVIEGSVTINGTLKVNGRNPLDELVSAYHQVLNQLSQQQAMIAALQGQLATLKQAAPSVPAVQKQAPAPVVAVPAPPAQSMGAALKAWCSEMKLACGGGK
jgi:hypothetical protein